MIPARREQLPVPEGLTRKKVYRSIDPDHEFTESEAITRSFESFESSGGDEDFSFSYERYKHASVRSSLETLFHGKCAYCEQRYAGVQPMDVEHFRPKGMAEYGDGRVAEFGYYWLAATWENLLPSCIDCNRGRKQVDIETGKLVLMGKANQFPLEPTCAPVERHTGDVSTEDALLLNPCDHDFDPRNHFLYLKDDGVIAPVLVDDGHGAQVPDPRAAASIRVFALNRPELVEDRLGYARIFDHRVTVLERVSRFLAVARAEFDDAELHPTRVLAETMHHDQIEALLDMARAERPFAGMIRYLLRTEVPQLADRVPGGG